jgi:hypothetical protein
MAVQEVGAEVEPSGVSIVVEGAWKGIRCKPYAYRWLLSNGYCIERRSLSEVQPTEDAGVDKLGVILLCFPWQWSIILSRKLWRALASERSVPRHWGDPCNKCIYSSRGWHSNTSNKNPTWGLHCQCSIGSDYWSDKALHTSNTSNHQTTFHCRTLTLRLPADVIVWCQQVHSLES